MSREGRRSTEEIRADLQTEICESHHEQGRLQNSSILPPIQIVPHIGVCFGCSGRLTLTLCLLSGLGLRLSV